MADRVEERIQQPLLDRALRRIRSVWSDLGFSRSARRQPSGPNLPPKDLRKVEALMLGCLREQSVATAARAQAAKLGYIYLTLNEAGRRRFLLLLTRGSISTRGASRPPPRRTCEIPTWRATPSCARPCGPLACNSSRC